MHQAKRAHLLHTGPVHMAAWLKTVPATFLTSSFLGKTGGLRWTPEQGGEGGYRVRGLTSVSTS